VKEGTIKGGPWQKKKIKGEKGLGCNRVSPNAITGCGAKGGDLVRNKCEGGKVKFRLINTVGEHLSKKQRITR